MKACTSLSKKVSNLAESSVNLFPAVSMNPCRAVIAELLGNNFRKVGNVKSKQQRRQKELLWLPVSSEHFLGLPLGFKNPIREPAVNKSGQFLTVYNWQTL